MHDIIIIIIIIIMIYYSTVCINSNSQRIQLGGQLCVKRFRPALPDAERRKAGERERERKEEKKKGKKEREEQD